eukprot:gene11053-3761_t
MSKLSGWSLLQTKIKNSPNSSPSFRSTSRDPIGSVDEAFDDYVMGGVEEEASEFSTNFTASSLSNLMKKDTEPGEVPFIFDVLVSQIIKKGLYEPQLFEKEMKEKDMSKISSIIAGLENRKIKLDKYKIHQIGFTFVQFLKDLKYPVIPKDLHNEFSQIYSKDKIYWSESNIEQVVMKIRKINEKIPTVNGVVLKKTIELLYLIVKNGSKNESSSIQLSKLFGKLLFHPKQNVHHSFQFILIMIRFYEDIFQNGIEKAYDIKFFGSNPSEEILFVFDESYDEIIDEKKKTKQVGISVGFAKEKVSKKAIKRGALKHKNIFTKKWSSCYLVLRVDKVMIFHSKEDFKNGKKQITSFTLEGAVIDDVADKKDHVFCFSIFSHNVDYIFQASSNEERIEWKENLISVMNGTIDKKEK